MKYYLIAGERSGDLHTSNLAKAIRKYDPSALMRGFGGDYMKAAGVDVAVHYNEMAVMGFWEVVKNLNKISRFIKRCKLDLIAYNPDVLILVDYGGFNKRIAAFAKQKGIKVFYYISPKVWAWNQKRAYKLKAIVDKMFVILPFEKEFYKKFDWDVEYVGNPVLDAVKAHQSDPEFLTRHQINGDAKIVALLPGSRKQELINMIPMMAQVAQRYPALIFAVATVNNVDQRLYAPLRSISNVRFVFEDTYNLLQNSSAAVVTSGTATLETALFKVPQVVVYKTSAITYQIVKRLIMVPYISLVNLIAKKEVVRELIQGDLTVNNVASELEALLFTNKRNDVMADYENILRILDTGSASENAGRLMVRIVSNAV